MYQRTPLNVNIYCQHTDFFVTSNWLLQWENSFPHINLWNCLLENEWKTFVLHSLPASSLVPVVQIKAVDRVCAAVWVVLWSRTHGILVHGGVGLSCCVVTWGQTVACLTAVVTIPVIYSTVLVIQSCIRREHKMNYWSFLKHWKNIVVSMFHIMASL